MLKELQNNVNYVYSGLAVITKKDGRVIEKNDYTKTAVYIKKMTEKEIKEYVKTGEPRLTSYLSCQSTRLVRLP